MDLFNSIKDWFTGLAGDSVSSVSENIPVEDIQQQASDVTSQVTETAENVKNNIPGQQ